MVIQQIHQPFKVAVEARLRIDVIGERIVRNRRGWLIAGAISVKYTVGGQSPGIT